MSDFLPKDYSIPQNGGKYMKFTQGENVFRVLTSPIIGWLDWKDNKPYRFQIDNKPTPFSSDRSVKHFWALVVWNYKEEAVQILEITQSGIQSEIKALVDDKDWGNPREYDIKITRTGESLETKYTVTPRPKSELANKPSIEGIDLNCMYENGDPFANYQGDKDPLLNSLGERDEVVDAVTGAGATAMDVEAIAQKQQDEINIADIPY